MSCWTKRITMALDAAKVGGGLVLVWCSGEEASVCLILGGFPAGGCLRWQPV